MTFVDPYDTAQPPAPVPAQGPAQVPDPGFADPYAGGGGQSIQLPTQPTMGGVTSGVSPDIGFFDHMRASLGGDTDTRIKRYAEIMQIPESRFGVLDGEIVVFDQQSGQYQKVVPDVMRGSPGEAFMRAGQNVAASTGAALPSVAGALTGIGMGPTPASIPASGAVAGAASLGVEALDKALAGEPVSPGETDYDYWGAFQDTLLNALGQGAGNLLVKLFTRNKLGVTPYDAIKALDPTRIQKAQDLQKIAREEYGVNLTAGQATGLRSLLSRERQASRWPETADEVYDFRDRQWGEQVPAAIVREIESISPVGGEAGVRAFREGGEAVVDAAVRARSIQAERAYAPVYAANPDVYSPRLMAQLDTKFGRQALAKTREIMEADGIPLAQVDRLLTNAMRRAVKEGRMPGPPGRVSKGLKLQTWDRIKRGLYELEQGALDPRTGIPTDTSRAYQQMRQRVTKELDRLDKTKGGYQRARDQFGDASDVVRELVEGGPGILQRMKGLDTARIVDGIFNEGRLTVEEMRRTRKAFLATGNKGAWDAGVARWLSGALNRALTEGTQTAGNIPGKFYKTLYGSPQQRQLTEAALGDNFLAVDRLMKILERARKSLPEGSPTSTDLGAVAPDPVSTGARRTGALFSGSTYLNLGQKAAEAVAEIRQPAARVRLMESLLEPDSVKQLRRLRMMSPTSGRAVQLVGDLLTKAGFGGLASILPSETRAAPADVQRQSTVPQIPAGR